MHKQRLDGVREGDGKKVAGGANARAGLETPPGFAARSRSNNVAKASMAVGERKAALPTPPPPASNGGKAGVSSANGGKAGGGVLSSNGVKTSLGPGGALSLCGENGAGEVADLAGFRGECEKALVALRRGNSTKALRIIRDACNRNQGCALLQRVQGHIYMRLASMIEDPNKKQRHLCAALEAAKKASVLSPQSVEYAYFYAQLLYETAKDSRGYEEVLRECDRALSVDTPVDPATESLHYDNQHEFSTPEARIAHVQQELRVLVQNVNMASISSWMKSLSNGTGEDKIHFIQMHKEQDRMEQRVLQPKRPHEVKKVVKTPEERRQEIEVRVTAARLLQQKAELPSISVSESQEEPEKALHSDRRKSGGSSSRRLVKTLSSEDRAERVRPFWHAADISKRDALLEVSIAELKEHLGFPKNNPSIQALAEALEFAQEKKTWQLWACCRCGERVTEYQDLIHHAMLEHIGLLPQKLQDVLPKELNQDWAGLLLEDDCRPVDGPAAVKVLFEAAQSGLSDDQHEKTASDCLSVLSTNMEPQSNDKIYGVSAESLPEDQLNHIDSKCNADCRKVRDMMQSTRGLHRHEFPVVEDEERRKLLDKVYSLCRVLIRNKCLANDHVTHIIKFATCKIQSMVPDPASHFEFDQSPVLIRFLDPRALLHIHSYLMELAEACRLDHSSDSTMSPHTTESRGEEIIQDQLFLNEDFTRLLLDDRVLHEFPEESVPVHVKVEEGDAKILSMNEKGDACLRPPLPLMKVRNVETHANMELHADLQLAWIYGSMEYEYTPSGWKQFRADQAVQGREALKLLERELRHCQGLCEKKLELMGYKEALNIGESICVQESTKVDNQCQKTYEMVPKEQHQEFIEPCMSGLSDSHKIEIDAIDNKIYSDVQNGQTHPPPYVQTLTLELSDSDDDEENWMLQESVHCADSHVESRKWKKLSNKLSPINAKIMKAMNHVHEMEAKVGQFAVLDYRAVVLPFVKSLLKSRLEGEAEKDAMKKSDAAQEAFLAELAKDKKSSTTKESELSKQARDKAKDKKKLRDQKKPRDVKCGLNSTEQESQPRSELLSLMAEHEMYFFAENSETSLEDCNSGSVTQDDDGEGGSWDLVEGKGHELFQQEAELQYQAELEAEELKLAEGLELQRCVEEEAKEQHGDEQHCKNLAQQSSMITPEPFNPEHLETQMDGCLHLPEPKTLVDSSPSVDTLTDESTISSIVLQPSYTPSTTSSHASLAGAGDVIVGSPEELQIDVGTLESDKRCTSDPSIGLTRPALEDPKAHQRVDLEEKVGCLECVPLESNRLTSDQPTGFPKKSRHRRKRGPQVHAEECMVTDQEGQVVLHGTASSLGPKILHEQNDNKAPQSLADSGSHDTLPLLLLPPPASTSEGGEHESKTLRQLQAEQDDEDRFQADLERALQQSLDMQMENLEEASSTAYLWTWGSLETSESVAPPQAEAAVGSIPTSEQPTEQTLTDTDVGKGLQNEIGQYNCFLNVVIQSLWHLKEFREELLAESSKQHMHVGEPCVVCALQGIFVGLSTSAFTTPSHNAVAPTALRVALSTMHSDSDFFQEAQMNDASEVLAVIFDCLHKAFVPRGALSHGELDGSSAGETWDCKDGHPCMVHGLFGLDVAEQMNCQGCELESRHLKYTAFFHNINASALRTAKVLYEEYSMDKLLKLVDMNHQLACDIDTGGCGLQNHIHHLLRAAPRVFTIVLGWQNGRESFEDISVTVDAIDVSMDVGVVYRGLDEGSKHQLISVVCYYGQHYHCFAYNQELARWVMFDDSTVKVVGDWEDVARTCRKGHLQPQVLFYEAVVACRLC